MSKEGSFLDLILPESTQEEILLEDIQKTESWPRIAPRRGIFRILEWTAIVVLTVYIVDFLFDFVKIPVYQPLQPDPGKYLLSFLIAVLQSAIGYPIAISLGFRRLGASFNIMNFGLICAITFALQMIMADGPSWLLRGRPNLGTGANLQAFYILYIFGLVLAPVFSGVVQWLYLRKKVRKAIWWMLAIILGSYISTTLSSISTAIFISLWGVEHMAQLLEYYTIITNAAFLVLFAAFLGVAANKMLPSEQSRKSLVDVF